jgi:murein DD-endopeptidase MepM/ murein hydrolase activator NlpD
MLHQRLFPQFAERHWARVNLDALARFDFPDESRIRADNPLNDPEKCTEWIKGIHKQLGADFSFGGYLEDRSHLWRGHYQEDAGSFLHLGIDYNVPAGTEVFSVGDLVVHEVWTDPDQDGGWGGRVILQVVDSHFYVIYSHLDPSLLPGRGAILKSGERIGLVGRPEVNGGWYPHLHLQCCDGEPPADLDGYAAGSLSEVKHYPDPEEAL